MAGLASPQRTASVAAWHQIPDPQEGQVIATGSVHPLLEALFDALDREGVVWCLLRGEARLDERGGDVDLLVARDDLGRLRRIAERTGFSRLPAWGYGSHAFFHAYDPPSDRWLKLDIVTELAFGELFSLRTDAAADCLRRRVRNGQAARFRLADGDAFWALALHCCLDKQAVSTDDGERLRELLPAARAGGPLARWLGELAGSGRLAERIVEAAEQADWTGLTGLHDELSVAWIRRQPGARIRTRARRVARRADTLRRLFRPCGLVVVFLGPEGAAMRPVEEIASSSPLPVHVVTPADLRQGFRIRRWRGAGLVLLGAQSLEGLPTVIPSRGGRGVRARLEAISCPRPDLVIRLGAGPPTGGGGGSDLRPSGSRVHVVDASLGPDALRRAASTIIWRRLVGRWTGRSKRGTNDR